MSRREELYALLGDLPPRDRSVTARQTGEEGVDTYVLESWVLDLNGAEAVPAIVARPPSLAKAAPAVLFNHSHGGEHHIGKSELVGGRPYLQPASYAKVLTDLGYVALCIDHWAFGARAHASEADTFKRMLWRGQVMWGAMVYDSLAALGWLASRVDVDATRLATIGMSMGSSMAQWVGALDERVKVTVDLHCLVDYQALLAEGGESRHGVYYFVPGLLKHFTASEINALIAPRAHLSVVGALDELAPIAGVNVIDRDLQRVYADAGCPERWQLARYDVGHQETPEARVEVIAFLRRFL